MALELLSMAGFVAALSEEKPAEEILGLAAQRQRLTKKSRARKSTCRLTPWGVCLSTPSCCLLTSTTRACKKRWSSESPRRQIVFCFITVAIIIITTIIIISIIRIIINI